MPKISKLYVITLLLTATFSCQSEEAKLEENLVKIVDSGLGDPPDYLEGVFLDINFSNTNHILRPPCDYPSNYFKLNEEYKISGFIVEVMVKNEFPVPPHSKVSHLIINNLVRSK